MEVTKEPEKLRENLAIGLPFLPSRSKVPSQSVFWCYSSGVLTTAHESRNGARAIEASAETRCLFGRFTTRSNQPAQV